MDYLFLDAVSWEYSQALYHASAHLGREALIILRPATPYVCIGFHQDAEQEIDLDYARRMSIPVFRREVGGGAVYLDGNQLFFQLIVRRDRPEVPNRIADFYRIFLEPVVETFRRFGVPAEYRPVNDIVTNGRKISGTGAAQIGSMFVLVGNFIQDFNYELMSRVLRVPDEKFRDKIHKTMYENLTTFLRETGNIPTNADLASQLAQLYVPLVGELVEARLDEELTGKADELLLELNTPEWLMANDSHAPDSTRVKISEGVYVAQKVLKTQGGLVRAAAVSREGRLVEVHISGDFFLFPANRVVDLEQALAGVQAETLVITKVVEDFYREYGIDSPGVEPADFGQLLAGA
jgi:lipoate---protein ligase